LPPRPSVKSSNERNPPRGFKVAPASGARLAYSVQEAADLPGVHHSTIRDLVATDRLLSRRAGVGKKRPKILIPASALKEWLEGQS
jgi:excisionase family DNA binding protein